MPSFGGYNFPVVLTPNGLVPQTPQSLNSQLIANVSSQVPGYTASLPGSLIEDISSTDTQSLVLIDQAKVENVNCLTPYGANMFTLMQQGQIYIGQGQPGQPTNTSVNVIFSSPKIGYVIPSGLLIGDGTNVYQVQTGGVIGSGGSSGVITAISINPGSFAVTAGTVTHILSSVPIAIALTVANPQAGTPGGPAETSYSFRNRILQAGLAASVGTPRYIKTLIGALAPAQANLVSVQPVSGGLKVVVGIGADVFEIANAIFQSVSDPSVLQGSVTLTRNVTVSLYDYPDNYNILFVQSPQQTVEIAIEWNTYLTSFTGGAAFAGLVQAPLGCIHQFLGNRPADQHS